MTRLTAITAIVLIVAPLAAAGDSPAPLVGRRGFDHDVDANVRRLMVEGQDTFRNDTFGDEDFWAARCGCTRGSPA
jgi:hypothetical protein